MGIVLVYGNNIRKQYKESLFTGRFTFFSFIIDPFKRQELSFSAFVWCTGKHLHMCRISICHGSACEDLWIHSEDDGMMWCVPYSNYFKDEKVKCWTDIEGGREQ